MFRPNLIGTLKRVTGFDLHAREIYAEPIECPFAQLIFTRDAERTTVRADSSGSRGSADETVSDASVLIVPYIRPTFGDRFEFDGFTYKIVGIHPRRSVTGALDHWECTLEALPV